MHTRNLTSTEACGNVGLKTYIHRPRVVAPYIMACGLEG